MRELELYLSRILKVKCNSVVGFAIHDFQLLFNIDMSPKTTPL